MNEQPEQHEDRSPRRCSECPPGTTRSAPHPGPRCTTHHRQRRNRRGEQQHRAQVRRNFGLVGDQYDQLREAQGGRCAICRIASGSARRLAVDHDHETGEVRGLLCAPCNRYVARVKNSPEAFARGLAYLIDPPARSVLPQQPEVDGPPLSDEERARAVVAAAEQVARRPHGPEPAGVS